MGAVFLGGTWLAIYLPNLGPAFRPGGWPHGLLIALYVMGVSLGPGLLIAIQGDEILGGLGLVAALLMGWSSAHLAILAGAAPGLVESLRLCGAALGPAILYGGFHLASRGR
jgi:hypothetical protein